MTLLVKVYLIKKYNKFVYGYNDVFDELNILEKIAYVIKHPDR